MLALSHTAWWQVWWRFACEASVRDNRKQRLAWSWPIMVKRRQQRTKYMALYTKVRAWAECSSGSLCRGQRQGT